MYESLPVLHTPACSQSSSPKHRSLRIKPQPTLQIGSLASTTSQQPFMPDDHSEVVPLLPIPNRTVKRLCADDSAGSRVKVGHRQASTPPKPPSQFAIGAFAFGERL